MSNIKRRDFLQSASLMLGSLSFLNKISLGNTAQQPGERKDEQARWQYRLVDIKTDDITHVMGYNGQLAGNLKRTLGAPRIHVFGFSSPGDTITWTVNVKEAGDYRASLVYCNGQFDNTDSLMEISAKGKKLTTTVKPPKIHSWLWGLPDRPAFRREWLDGVIPLVKGKNTIQFRIAQVTVKQARLAQARNQFYFERRWPISAWPKKSLHFSALELVPEPVYPRLLKNAERLRSNASWLAYRKYGIFIHWSSRCYPLFGKTPAHKNYQWGVEQFDPEAFAEMAAETGAGWLIFTATHSYYNFPGPCKTIDRVLPGRTSKRDLIAEIADALNKRDIRLLLYFSAGPGHGGSGRDREWSKTSGILDVNDHQANQIMLDIFTELGERYKNKVWGWMLDAGEALYNRNINFENLTKSLKTGNPDRIVAYHVWLAPKLTPFGDYLAMDLGGAILPPMPRSYFAQNGPFERLHPQFNFTMEGHWVAGPLNGTFPDPRYTPGDYVDYFKYMADQQWPLTINLLISQDVTKKQPFVNPICLEIMRSVRRTIRSA